MREVHEHVFDCTIPCVLCLCWDYPPFSLTEPNRYNLRHRLSYVPHLLLVHLASVLAVALQYLQEQIVVRTFQFLVRYAPKTSHFLAVFTVLALQQPELLQIRLLRFLSLAGGV